MGPRLPPNRGTAYLPVHTTPIAHTQDAAAANLENSTTVDNVDTMFLRVMAELDILRRAFRQDMIQTRAVIARQDQDIVQIREDMAQIRGDMVQLRENMTIMEAELQECMNIMTVTTHAVCGDTSAIDTLHQTRSLNNARKAISKECNFPDWDAFKTAIRSEDARVSHATAILQQSPSMHWRDVASTPDCLSTILNWSPDAAYPVAQIFTPEELEESVQVSSTPLHGILKDSLALVRVAMYDHSVDIDV